jgi:hypothetical protein
MAEIDAMLAKEKAELDAIFGDLALGWPTNWPYSARKLAKKGVIRRAHGARSW